MSNSNSASIVEAYKSIRAELSSIFEGTVGAVSIAIVSPAVGDGRTTTAINTAVAFSQCGKKVLLIDGDMKRGSVYKKMKLSSMYGLAELLSGSCDFDRAVVTVSPMLDVMTAGSLTLDTAALLSSGEFDNIIEGLSFVYDVIIIDTPAVNTCNDAEIIASKTNGALLVLRSDVTSCKDIDYTLGVMKNCNANLVGTVLNGVK